MELIVKLIVKFGCNNDEVEEDPDGLSGFASRSI